MAGTIIRKAFISGLVATISTVAAPLAGSAHAAAETVRYVSPDGHDSGDCTSSPCRTIGYAITQSTPGDTIEVAAGTYPERVAIDRSLTIHGEGSFSTFVDGQGEGTVITVRSADASLSVALVGLTIQGGMAEAGGGIRSTPATVRPTP